MHPGEIARREPDAIAIVMGERRISYRALDAASRRLAALARQQGLERGDVLAVLSPNGPEFLAAMWAAQRSGLYALPLGTRLTAQDIAYILSDSGARLLLVGTQCGALAAQAMREIEDAAPGDSTAAPVAVALDGDPLLFMAQGAPRDPDPVEGGDMLYTSGTTGRPKGVRRPLTYAPLGSELARAERLKSLFRMDGDSVFLSPAPLYHAAPLRFSMALLRLGARLVLMPRFDARQALALLASEQVTHSQWVPTMFNRLLALPAELRGGLHAPAHRVAIHAGAPCPEAIKRRMIEWWGPILEEYYSGTESVGFTHITSAQWLQRPGSVGRPWGCAVHVLDDEGGELSPGEVGTVFFSGRGTPDYYNAPEKTASAQSPQGYSTMGDIGYLDEEGYLFLTDRKAFTIISGGVNIYPREIEDVLYGDHRVAEAAVFGVPDDDLGETVAAVIQLRAGMLATREMAGAIRGDLEERLARFKLPRRVAFQATLPLTDSGKVHKARIRDSWRELAPHAFDFSDADGAPPGAAGSATTIATNAGSAHA